jgi:hypothetical protein
MQCRKAQITACHAPVIGLSYRVLSLVTADLYLRSVQRKQNFGQAPGSNFTKTSELRRN